MAEKRDRSRNSDLWDLLNEYADIRDELEDALLSLRELHTEIEYAMEDIADELESVQEHLTKCSGRLMRFRNPQHKQYAVIKEQGDLPLMD